MSYEYSEDGLSEQATQDVLEELGWQVLTAWKKESFGEDGLLGPIYWFFRDHALVDTTWLATER